MLSDKLLLSLTEGSGLALLLAFFAGVLTSATPCVYPLIPITVSTLASITSSDNNGKSRLSSFYYAVIFALGLATVYASLGLLAASTGQLFGQIASHPVSYFVVANLCFLLGAWMIGWFHFGGIDMSRLLSNRLFASVFPVHKIQIINLRVFLAGAASGLVAGPCTAPVLASLLAYVGQSGEVLYGGALLFAFALGLSSLLIMIGTFSGFLTLLPRSGQWMQGIKGVLAFMMFAMGEYFLIKMGMLLF